MASAKKGYDPASGSSLKRPRRGQMRQVRQMRGRFKSTKLPQTSKLSRFSLSFERGRCGRCGRFFKNFSAHEATDSPKLTQNNSTRTPRRTLPRAQTRGLPFRIVGRVHRLGEEPGAFPKLAHREKDIPHYSPGFPPASPANRFLNPATARPFTKRLDHQDVSNTILLVSAS